MKNNTFLKSLWKATRNTTIVIVIFAYIGLFIGCALMAMLSPERWWCMFICLAQIILTYALFDWAKNAKL